MNGKKNYGADKKRAVTLSYEMEKSAAPKVGAMGEGHIAEKIIKIARDNNVPFYSDADLCQTLFTLDIGSEIPEAMYEAIASVLVFIYRANKEYTGTAKDPWK